MTDYSPTDDVAAPATVDHPASKAQRRRIVLTALHFAGISFLLIPILYLLTLARSLVLGDPTEFTFVANILGIAHPPGYAFITLVGKLFQTIIPLGSIPWRMHLLSAAAATAGALFLFSIVRLISRQQAPGQSSGSSAIAAAFAALTVATAADYWQHAIHANPHIITAAFLAANLFFLTKWWAQNDPPSHPTQASVHRRENASERWLYAFCISAGLGITHHPLTVFAFPAYAIFILWVRPGILKEWRAMAKMMGFALIGLSLWLYFPIRSAMMPEFGPSSMNTLDGFLDHVLARGLTESLPFYAWAQQPDRAMVFWTLLRLQYSLPVIFLAILGFAWLLRRGTRPLFFLYGLAFIANYAFVISLKAQDIMAYLLGPFLLVGLSAGVGLWAMFHLLQRRRLLDSRTGLLLTVSLMLLGPVLQVARNLPHISLRGYEEGQAYVDSVHSTFGGKAEGAVLLNDWEHMTPLWYMRFVEDQWPDEADVRPILVSTARSWLDNVFDHLAAGPVYLSNYRRDVVDAGFRLRPVGPFFRVTEPGATGMPSHLVRASLSGGEIDVVGYSLPERTVTAGDYVPLTIAMRSPEGTNDYVVPLLHVGEVDFPFTTDSHLTSPEWQPGEVIVERFDFALPHDLPAGDYEVTLGLKNLSADQEVGSRLSLGQLSVRGRRNPMPTDHLLGNFRQRVGLVSAVATTDGRRTSAPWPVVISASPGDHIRLRLKWQSLAPAEESYTVFVHLIDLANRPVVDNLDYTPLGGAAPTHLWIPKWLPGQQMLDPYRLEIPPHLPAGTYRIEVGLYEMVSRRRLHLSDKEGNLVGDRLILGDVLVGELE